MTTIKFASKIPARLRAASLLACVLALTACSDMDTTEQRTLSGGAIGAGVGTVGTLMTGGCVACGAAIGAGVGAAGGYIYDKVQQHNDQTHVDSNN